MSRREKVKLVITEGLKRASCYLAKKPSVSHSPLGDALPGDMDRLEDESTAGDDGGRRCLAGRVG